MELREVEDTIKVSFAGREETKEKEMLGNGLIIFQGSVNKELNMGIRFA